MVDIEVANNATVQQIIDRFQLPAKMVHLVVINGVYVELADRLTLTLNEGDALPSVRQVAADFQLNPITVSKAYQELVDEQLIEKRRGLGMYVMEGARESLLRSERERFLREEWPLLAARLKRLGLDLRELADPAAKFRPDAEPGARTEGEQA